MAEIVYTGENMPANTEGTRYEQFDKPIADGPHKTKQKIDACGPVNEVHGDTFLGHDMDDDGNGHKAEKGHGKRIHHQAQIKFIFCKTGPTQEEDGRHQQDAGKQDFTVAADGVEGCQEGYGEQYVQEIEPNLAELLQNGVNNYKQEQENQKGSELESSAQKANHEDLLLQCYSVGGEYCARAD